MSLEILGNSSPLSRASLEEKFTFKSDKTETLYKVLDKNVSNYCILVLKQFYDEAQVYSKSEDKISYVKWIDIHLISDVIRKHWFWIDGIEQAKEEVKNIALAYGNMNWNLYWSRRIDWYSSSRLDNLDREDYDTTVNIDDLSKSLLFLSEFIVKMSI